MNMNPHDKDQEEAMSDENYTPLRSRPLAYGTLAAMAKNRRETPINIVPYDPDEDVFAEVAEEMERTEPSRSSTAPGEPDSITDEDMSGRAEATVVGEPSSPYGSQAPQTCSFRQLKREPGQPWGIRVPLPSDHGPGDTVTVTKKSGESQELKLGREVARFDDAALYTIDREPKEERKPKAPKADSKPEYREAGMYRLEDGTIVRVYFGQESGYMLAKKLVDTGERETDDDGHEVQIHEWEYLGAASRFVEEDTPRLSIEEAAEFGTMTRSCAVCSRRLDVPESVERGIGPKCFARMESDNWLTPKQMQRLGLA